MREVLSLTAAALILSGVFAPSSMAALESQNICTGESCAVKLDNPVYFDKAKDRGVYKVFVEKLEALCGAFAGGHALSGTVFSQVAAHLDQELKKYPHPLCANDPEDGFITDDKGERHDCLAERRFAPKAEKQIREDLKTLETALQDVYSAQAGPGPKEGRESYSGRAQVAAMGLCHKEGEDPIVLKAAQTWAALFFPAKKP